MIHGATAHPIDTRLFSWEELDVSRPEASLLLGNGASCAVWSRFAYPSLFQAATSLPAGQGLDSRDLSLFSAFDSTDFERVLRALLTSAT